ncbi:hypothetical protein [Komagataeibacter europaeus]|nr:hypothetical protein [Komagataeibacter europaeus]
MKYLLPYLHQLPPEDCPVVKIVGKAFFQKASANAAFLKRYGSQKLLLL